MYIRNSWLDRRENANLSLVPIQSWLESWLKRVKRSRNKQTRSRAVGVRVVERTPATERVGACGASTCGWCRAECDQCRLPRPRSLFLQNDVDDCPPYTTLWMTALSPVLRSTQVSVYARGLETYLIDLRQRKSFPSETRISTYARLHLRCPPVKAEESPTKESA